MSVWNALGAGGRVAGLVLGAIGIGAVGYLGWQITRPSVAPDAPPAAVAETAPPTPETPVAAAAPAASAPEVADDAAAAAPPPPDPPQFDTWRVATDGAAVVSGRAAPGALVSVLVDGVPVAEAKATPSGEFAALFSLPLNDKPSLMSLMMTLPDGGAVPSDQTVALAAIDGGPAAAAATDATAPATDATSPATDTTTPATDTTAPAETAPPVEPDNAPAAILLTDEGAVVLQDPVTPEPEVLANVSIDTIAYTPEGAVQLGGRGQPGSVLRLYLDNAPVQTVAVPQDGRWLTTLGDTAPGLYTLRVDQIDTAGKVTSRFETPFKRETLEALASAAGDAAPEPAAPEPAATEPAAPEPETSEPAAPEPVTSEPTTPEPATTEPSTPEPAAPEAAPAPRVTEAAPEPAAPETADQEVAEAAPAAATTEIAEARPAQTGETAPPPPVTITVQPGFTLWGIAQATMGEGVMYVQVFEANKDKIKDPDLIYPGQVFALPEGD